MTDVGSPLVSVIVATYNMGQYVVDAVESVLAQTMVDLDVHVIDDGSTDDTALVMERYASDPRVFYYRQQNQGQARAKNEGIARSSGQFVAFCDADDMWKPFKLEKQLPLLQNRDAMGVVYSRTARLGASGKESDAVAIVPYSSGRVTAALFKYNFIPFGTAVVRRHCLEEMGAFDERYRMGIDWELWLRLSTKYEIGFLDEVTYIYRIWEGQMSGDWRGRYEHCFRIMKDFLSRHPGVLSADVVQEAWAHSFVGRGYARSQLSREHAAGIGDAMTALRYRPTYRPAWKLLFRIAATALGIPSRQQPASI